MMFLFQIEKLDLPFDKMKDERKRFCFVEFDSETAVNNLCDDESVKHVIAGKEVRILEDNLHFLILFF